MADPIDKPALRALVAHAYDMRLSERRGADILSVMRKLADACLALLDRNAELTAEGATLRGCVTNLRQQLTELEADPVRRVVGHPRFTSLEVDDGRWWVDVMGVGDMIGGETARAAAEAALKALGEEPTNAG